MRSGWGSGASRENQENCPAHIYETLERTEIEAKRFHAVVERSTSYAVIAHLPAFSPLSSRASQRVDVRA